MIPQIRRLKLAAIPAMLMLIAIAVFGQGTGRKGATDSAELREAIRLGEQFAELREAGDPKAALLLGEQMVKAYEKALGPSHPSVSAALYNLGMLYSDNGDYPKARSLLDRAIKDSLKSLGPWHPNIAKYFIGRSIIYMEESEYSSAEKLLQNALAIVYKTKGEESVEAGDVFFYLARVNFQRGDYENALAFCHRALRIKENALGPEHKEVAEVLSTLGRIYEKSHDYLKAALRYEHALSIAEKVYGPDHPNIAMYVLNLGIMNDLRDELDEAEGNFQRALRIIEKSSGPESLDAATVLNSLSIIYREKGEYEKSEQAIRRSLAIIEKQSISISPGTLNVLNNFARLYEAKGDIEPAIQMMSRLNEFRERFMSMVIRTGSEKQKLDYMRKDIGQRDDTISLHALYAPNHPVAIRMALTTLLRSKGRVLDAVTDSTRVFRSQINPSNQQLLTQLLTIRSRIATLTFRKRTRAESQQISDQISELEKDAQALEARIYDLSASSLGQAQAVTIEQIQRLIPEDAALVEMASYSPYNAQYKKQDDIWHPVRYIAYVLHRAGDPQWVDLGEANLIDEETESFLQALRNPNRSDVKQLARKLDQKIMAPIRKLLGTSRTILISPDGSLNLIPFGALVDEEGKYLIERFSLTYLTTGRDLLKFQDQPKSKQEPVVIANPDFNYNGVETKTRRVSAPTRNSNRRSGDLSRMHFDMLSATDDEARVLAKILQKAIVLTGRQATETSLKQIHGPSILHIATHGFFLPNQDARSSSDSDQDANEAGKYAIQIENPLLRSGLVLAGANKLKNGKDDGVLTALEAAGLDLSGTRLVVLSACETGRGEINYGEGIYGLRRALVVAGAESQVISLWKVDDEATRDLMLSYYRGLMAGEGRNAALRKVQLGMLSDKIRQHPYYWAGFIASGDWANLEGKR
jgi:CHAT domain-containing protein/Flp pilus assembly protein TadD